MTLDEFIKKYEINDNEFWILSSGEHQNLLDEAIEKIEKLEEENRLMRIVLIDIWDLSLNKVLTNQQKLDKIYKQCSEIKKHGIWLN